MTKRRDRYESHVDDLPVRGVQAACHDLSSVLVDLGEFAKQRDLLDADVAVGYRGETLYIHFGDLLAIALEAFETSISEACWVYQRLQENEEAAFLMAETMDDPAWLEKSEALTQTLNNKAVVSRGFVSEARRVLARRDKEAAKKRGGDAA